MTPATRRPWLTVGLLSAVLVAILVWGGLVLARAIPPRTIVLTAGPEGEADYELGLRYRAALERKGVRVEVASSAGKVENLQRLNEPKSRYDAGFASGGLTTAAESPRVVSLGTIAYDPLWIFCRGVEEPVRFAAMEGRRVSIGPEGSATRLLVNELLRLNHLEGVFRPLPLRAREGGEALERGEIDCACMLSYAEAPTVRRLLASERVSLMSYPRADAYVALFPFLRKVVVPMGVGNLAANRPPQDVTLLAPAESLVVRDSLHPALQYLLLQAAEEIHSGAGILQRPGQFPASEPVDVPLSSEARQFYKSGGTFLQRHLPFWLWVFASNLLIVLVPLIGVVYPLAQLVPAAIKFEVDRRLSRLYGELREIEERMDSGNATPAKIAAELDRLEERIGRTRVPKSSAPGLYTLRVHAGLVRERLSQRAEAAPPQVQPARPEP